MSGVGITYLWASKEFPPFVRLEGRRGDYEVYTPERTCRIEGSYYDDLFEETCTDLSCGHSVWQMESPLYCPECGARVIGTEVGE